MSAPASTVIYTRIGCPFCEKVKDVYKMKGWSFVEYVLDRDFNRDKFYAEFGEGSTFPQVVIGAKPVGGCTDTIQYLREQKLI
jgi:glutaredoxin 3